jgi:hypothetical protein
VEQHTRVLRVRQRLIKAAKNGELVNYGEFIYNPTYCVARGQSQPHKIGNVLGEICETERSAGRPLLCAICVLKGSGMPSSGFWRFLGTKQPDRKKWENERDRVFNYPYP